MARLSDTEAIVTSGMRPAAQNDPFGPVVLFVPIEDCRTTSQRMPKDSQVGPERLRGATQVLGKHYGVAAKD